MKPPIPKMRRTRRALARMLDPQAERLLDLAHGIMCNVHPEPKDQREEWDRAFCSWEVIWLSRWAS